MRMKKILAATLAATMVMATGLTTFAATESGSSASESTSVAGTDAQYVATADGTVTVAGSNVKTTVAGCFAAKNVQGVAVVTPAADLTSKLGLTAGQKAYVTVYDTDAKKSSKAMESLNAAAQAVGGSIVSTVDFDLFAKQAGKKVVLSNGAVQVTVGLPKTAEATKSYVVVRVVPGGEVTVLDNTSANPNAVTFEVAAGQGTYAIVAK